MISYIWRVRACKADQPTNPNPIKMHAGDLVEITGKEDGGWTWCRDRAGKESWVPLSYLISEDGGRTRTALCDYDATELSVEVGEEFQVEREEHGWLWCKNMQGKWGWVRVTSVERLN